MNKMASGFGFSRRRWSAFTLIELLVVIAIISLLAAMIIPITGAVNRQKFKARGRAELTQIETAIESYKTKLGHYPPDNPGMPSTNQLYFELLGTTNSNGTFWTLDGSASLAQNQFAQTYGPNGVTGFINTSQGASDESRTATRFLFGLKPAQVGQWSATWPARFLVCSIPWDRPGQTWTLGVPGLNPICYNSSNPTNNPQSYDLWVDVIIGGKTNRICNWSKDPIVVYSYPNAVQE
jgi:prepilin-type N-terminal cleavage/methylation domain-containing protein